MKIYLNIIITTVSNWR